MLSAVFSICPAPGWGLGNGGDSSGAKALMLDSVVRLSVQPSPGFWGVRFLFSRFFRTCHAALALGLFTVPSRSVLPKVLSVSDLVALTARPAVEVRI